MKHINIEQIDPPFAHFGGVGIPVGDISFRASTQIDLKTDMGEQNLYLGANGKTRESAIAHLEALVKRVTKAMELVTELPKPKKAK